MSEYNPFSLLGKNILITGASSGIGRAIAIECSKMGAICLITGRNEERLKETLGKMEGDGHQWVVADMRNDRNVIVDRVQKIDGVVHCAGVADTMLFQYVDDQKLRDVMEINFFIPAQLSRDLLSQKKLNKAASIIFISSI
ncbi:MAG: SDR family oxidoreductase, partial [Odoribacter sp.]|nr:SDR family oxidoreductase [Odoribacter sp.]